MVDLNPYGRKGCRCFQDRVDVTGSDGIIQYMPGRWMPNASCPFHGVLAEFTPPRDETGTYRVVDLNDRLRAGIEQAERGETKDRGSFAGDTDGEYCPPGVHSMFDFRPGRAVCEEGFHSDTPIADKMRSMTPEEAEAISEAMRDPNAPTRRLPPRLPEPYVCKIKEEERGVLATVRRWARHFWRGRPGWH